jgi:AraC family transcriptional regulator
MGTTRELFRGDGLSVVEHVCAYGPEDRPFEEWHRASHVAFVVEGAFDVRGPAGSVALGPGSVLLGNEGDPYTCVHEGRGDVCVSFGYSADLLEEAGRSLGLRPRFRGLSLGPMPGLAAVPAVARKSPASMEEVALDLLGRILDADAGSPRRLQRPRPADERRAVAALRHIDAHAGEPLSLSTLAERARLTRFHFLRSFRAAVGTTPHQSVLAARLRRAAKLLLDTRLAVTDVALESGFGDLSNFIRTFRRATGSSPRVFRATGGSAR